MVECIQVTALDLRGVCPIRKETAPERPFLVPIIFSAYCGIPGGHLVTEDIILGLGIIRKITGNNKRLGREIGNTNS